MSPVIMFPYGHLACFAVLDENDESYHFASN